MPSKKSEDGRFNAPIRVVPPRHNLIFDQKERRRKNLLVYNSKEGTWQEISNITNYRKIIAEETGT